uniref:Glucose-methanol-choline oxidoreductase C-terminal domain-containing protein n=1 Tax=Populus davidiana TaxID=266767 RepID=A0A6M2EXN6_9ROSI
MSMSITRFTSTRPQHNSSSSGELRNYCKQNVGTHYHYHGGCTVGSVVDKDYKVHGMKGLRVIDGSTFWESPGTLLMLERYRGIKILEEREIASPFAAQPCP